VGLTGKCLTGWELGCTAVWLRKWKVSQNQQWHNYMGSLMQLLNYWLTYLLTQLLIYLFTYLLTYLLNYSLTHSMEQSPSWEANRFSSSQETPFIWWNPKVPYFIHKSLPPIPILSQTDPVRAPTSHFLKIYLNPLLSLTLWSARNLNVPCRPKRSKVLLLTIKKADFL
jgi:hypothetical protein